MNYFLISNDCTGGFVYQFELYPDKHSSFIEYNSPFIASVFANNETYVKFCENYDYYISLEPFFDEPIITKREIFRRGDGKNHPVMFLGDIEIHWSHDTNKTLLLNKFKGRLELSKNLEPIFIWSDLAFDGRYTIDEDRNILINRFNSILYKTVFFTKYSNEEYKKENTIVKFIPEWEDKIYFDRKYRYSSRGMICKTYVECINTFYN
jgi:uncharacterized protein (DUF1919 family)